MSITGGYKWLVVHSGGLRVVFVQQCALSTDDDDDGGDHDDDNNGRRSNRMVIYIPGDFPDRKRISTRHYFSVFRVLFVRYRSSKYS